MVQLVVVYYPDKIGIRVFGSDIVLFEKDMTKENWEYLLSKAV